MNINTNDIVKIACIGGGPGSDLSGVISHLLSLKVKSFKGMVYDYNYLKWKSVAYNLPGILKFEANKFDIKIQTEIDWEFIDMTKSNSIGM